MSSHWEWQKIRRFGKFFSMSRQWESKKYARFEKIPSRSSRRERQKCKQFCKITQKIFIPLMSRQRKRQKYQCFWKFPFTCSHWEMPRGHLFEKISLYLYEMAEQFLGVFWKKISYIPNFRGGKSTRRVKFPLTYLEWQSVNGNPKSKISFHIFGIATAEWHPIAIRFSASPTYLPHGFDEKTNTPFTKTFFCSHWARVFTNPSTN